MNMPLPRTRPKVGVAIFALAAGGLFGCATAPAPAPDTAPSADPASADWPAFAQPAANETVYRVDESASALLARVDPSGPMARLGHSHVVGGAVLSGRIVTGAAAPRAEVHVRVRDLAVDRPAWRRAHGLKAELDASAIEGTRRNLLGPRVMDAESHPRIDVRSVAVSGPAWLPEVELAIRWRGRVRQFGVPVAIRLDGERIEAVGRFDLRHSDFGLDPFSAAGGALRVSDRIQIRFRIVATAVASDVAIIADQPMNPGTPP